MGVYGRRWGFGASILNLPEKAAYFHFNQYKGESPELFRMSPIPSVLLCEPSPYRDSNDF